MVVRKVCDMPKGVRHADDCVLLEGARGLFEYDEGWRRVMANKGRQGHA